MSRRSLSTWLGGPVLILGLLLLSLSLGERLSFGLAGVFQGFHACLGLGPPLPGPGQTIFEIRLWSQLTALLVGASLALAGCMLQGLFRNPLASPSLLGVTGGAGFGATLAVIALGDMGPEFAVEAVRAQPLFAVPLAACLGAAASLGLVLAIGLRLGRGSMTNLLLVGIALTAFFGGATALLQNLALDRFDVSRAIVAWGLGTLADRSSWHLLMAGVPLALALCFLPFLHRELDLFSTGEEDAQGLGVHPLRTKAGIVVLSSLLTGGAVAAAGPIAFIGLVVPNLCRFLLGPSHLPLLLCSMFMGAAFLLGMDTVQRVWLPYLNLRPGVLMALIGAPFFLVLLVRLRGEVEAW